MSVEPPRLRATGSRLEQELLTSTETVALSSAAHQRVFRRVLASSTGRLSWFSPFPRRAALLAVAALASVAGAHELSTRHTSVPQAARPKAQSIRPAKLGERTVPIVVPPEPVLKPKPTTRQAPSEKSVPPPQGPQATPSRETSPPRQSSAPSDESQLSIELSLLRSARAALAKGQRKRAAELLRQHRRRFSSPQLQPERAQLEERLRHLRPSSQ